METVNKLCGRISYCNQDLNSHSPTPTPSLQQPLKTKLFCSCECKLQTTVMIRFTAQGTYLLLVAQGRVLIGEGVLIRDGKLILFSSLKQMTAKKQ